MDGSPQTLKLLVVSVVSVEARPFFPNYQIDGGILRASVRRAISGLIPLATRAT